MSAAAGASFGHLLRRYRKAAGLTQEELAERALLSAYTVSALERGANQSPRKDTLALLADALGLDPAERVALEAAARSPASAPTPAAPSPAPPPLPRPAGPLVGRGHELALLDQHLVGEGPPVLLLAGEPGIGKSRLLQEAQARAHTAGWAVLAGGCRRVGQDPYAPLPATLEQRLRRASPAQARAELEGCAWLARLLPEVADLGAEPLPSWTITPPQERRLVVRAAERYLRNVAGPAGTLLVLDDIQWAGPDGLEVLASLLEWAEEIPLRVVAAYRSTEAATGEPLGDLVADLLGKGRAARRALPPLPEEEATALLDALLADRPVLAEDRAEVVRRAEGLPFFLVSCVEGLAAGGPGVRVPESVAGSIQQRVAALAPAAREVLRAAAVVGRVVERAVLTAASGLSPAEVLEGLEAACRAHLLEEEGNNAYRFPHDLVREVVEGNLSAARRAALHQQVAETLEAREGVPDVELLAYHYCRSDAAEKAVEYLEKAGGHATAMGANAAAEGYYRDLARRLEVLGRRVEAAHIYARLGLHLERIWRYGDAQEALQQCFSHYVATMATHQIDGHSTTTGADLAPDSLNIGHMLAFIEVRESEQARGAMYLAFAALLQHQGRHEDCLVVTERAAALAQRRGDAGLLAEILFLRAESFFALSRLGDFRDSQHEARRICEANGYMGLLVPIYLALQMSYGMSGEPDQSVHHHTRAQEVADLLGDPVQRSMAVMSHCLHAFYVGDWPRAQADLNLAVALDPHITQSNHVLIWRGILHLTRGDWADAATLLEDAAAVSDSVGAAWAHRWLAELEVLDGRPEAAIERLHPFLWIGLDHGWGIMINMQVHAVLAWAQFQLGRLDEAAATLAVAEERFARAVNYVEVPVLLRVKALVAIERGTWDEAVQALEEGFVVTRRIPYPYEIARILEVYAHLHRRKGEPALARQRLEEAQAIFKRLGAPPDVDRVERQLVDLARSSV